MVKSGNCLDATEIVAKNYVLYFCVEAAHTHDGLPNLKISLKSLEGG